jgi:hypothetical protein
MSTTVEQRGRSLGPSPNNQAERRRSQSPNPLFRQEYANKKSQTFDFKHPICEGYLFKQGHFAHVFNKRYFVLYPGRLLYYKSESDFEHDKTRDHLSKGVVEMNTDGLYLTKPAKKPKGGKFSWVLHLPNPFNHRNEILLVAHTKEERHLWMTKLQAVNPKLHPHAEHHTQEMSPECSPTPQRSITTDSVDHNQLCVVDLSDDEGCSNKFNSPSSSEDDDHTHSDDDHTHQDNKECDASQQKDNTAGNTPSVSITTEDHTS